MKKLPKILEDMQKDILIQKYLYQFTWLSGCNTKVYPISAHYKNDKIKDIIIQLKTDKNYFNKLLERYKKKYKSIEYCYFSKSDGSCPSQLVFIFKEM